MTDQEADQVAGYVFAAFPTQAEKISDLTWQAWRDILTRFPLSVGRTAAKQYLEGGNAFIPQPGEIALIADRVWQAVVKKNQAEDRAQDKLGWRQIEDKTRDDVGRATLPMIQAYLAGKIERAAYVAGIRALDQRFPGLGFAASADDVASVGSVAIKP